MAQARILIVDDEAVILSSLQEMFGQDFTLFTAPDARGGARDPRRAGSTSSSPTSRCRAWTGSRCSSRSSGATRAVIRVLMTAYADMQLVIRAMNEGEIHRFISKPYKSFEFRRILEECPAMARIVERRRSEPQGRTVLVAHESMISQAALRLLLTPGLPGAHHRQRHRGAEPALDAQDRRGRPRRRPGAARRLLDRLLPQEGEDAPRCRWSSGPTASPAPYEDYLRECGADLVLDQRSQDSLTQLQQFLKKRFS